MLYQALRPDSFDEFIGNEEVVSSLKTIVDTDSAMRPHAYLFSGDSGCGKTTLARIMAKELGCEGVDLQELNAANTRGIDTVRDVVNTCSFGPMLGDVKVYIFDESHQLTSAAQEALLKVIEDTPLFCYFFFCTTNPQGLIKTIRNRCAHYELKRLRRDDMLEVLLVANIGLEANVDDCVLNKIVREADGCPREALVMFEKIMGMEKEQALNAVTSAQFTEKTVLDLCRVITKSGGSRWRDALRILSSLNTKDSEGIRRQILGYLNSCLLKANDQVSARRFASMIEIMDNPTFNSGLPLLSCLVYEICER